jgi:RNA-directed DNA polymerase
VSLATPPKLRRLQEALYTKAKQEPAYRFYLLYDKVYRADLLAHAYALAKANGGAPGVDGVTFEDIEAAGLERWLAAVQEALRTETYRAQPVRRVVIPKPGGRGERPLGIPVLRDRVVQTAALLILQPIFEADLESTAYGYRPGRTALEAVQKVHRALCAGHTEVIDADVSQYFDTIPHADLMKSLARRISDRKMLRLLKMWLKVPVAEETTGRRGAVQWWEASHARDAPGWGDFAVARQHLYESVPESLSSPWARPALRGAARQLRGRLRGPVSERGGGGARAESSVVHPDGTAAQRAEDPGVRWAARDVYLSGLQLRADAVPEDWS